MPKTEVTVMDSDSRKILHNIEVTRVVAPTPAFKYWLLEFPPRNEQIKSNLVYIGEDKAKSVYIKEYAEVEEKESAVDKPKQEDTNSAVEIPLTLPWDKR